MKNFCKTQRLELQLANRLDSIMESKNREQCLDSLLTLKLINGGYKEKYWSFGEGIEKHAKLAQKGNARDISQKSLC